MAIKRFAGDRFSGQSSDTKPTNVLSGATFFETDTGRIFTYDGSSWTEAPYSDSSDLSDYQLLSEKDQANGYAGLDSSGLIKTSQLPDLAITETHVVADITARDNLTVQEGDVAVVEDASGDPDVDSGAQSYIWDGSEWHALKSPDDVVQSVNGETGTVTLDTDDISEGASNLYYTETRVSNNSDVSANTSARHDQNTDTELAQGTADAVTAASLRTHLDDGDIHAPLDDASTTASNLWSADQIQSQIEAHEGLPGGSDTEIQFNDSDAFGGSPDFTWDNTAKIFRAAAYHKIAETSAALPSVSRGEIMDYVETEEVGTDTITRVKSRLSNGTDVIVASFVEPT